jgi:hypothetical protein
MVPRRSRHWLCKPVGGVARVSAGRERVSNEKEVRPVGVRDSAELFGMHAPHVPDDQWFAYLTALAEFAVDGHEPFEPEWD